MSQCKLASKDTPKQERLDAHKAKMEKKDDARFLRYDRQKTDPVYTPANLGVNHPDYGMSWADHQVEKQARQKSS